jgi:hypothetical protein
MFRYSRRAWRLMSDRQRGIAQLTQYTTHYHVVRVGELSVVTVTTKAGQRVVYHVNAFGTVVPQAPTLAQEAV